MAKNTNISDIDAQIAALKKQKKALGEKAELPLPKQPEVAADEEPNIDLF